MAEYDDNKIKRLFIDQDVRSALAYISERYKLSRYEVVNLVILDFVKYIGNDKCKMEIDRNDTNDKKYYIEINIKEDLWKLFKKSFIRKGLKLEIAFKYALSLFLNRSEREIEKDIYFRDMKCNENSDCFGCTLDKCFRNRNVKYSGFWEFVDKRNDDGHNGHNDGQDACWNWKGAIRQGGYGYFSWFGKNYAAHRLSYQLTKGDIPKGMFICHKCNNPRCVNPSHLYIGDAKDNARDFVNSNKRIFSQEEKGLIKELFNRGYTKSQILQELKRSGYNFTKYQILKLRIPIN